MTRDEVWDFLSLFFSRQLTEQWDTVTINGQTIEQKYGICRETCAQYRVGFAPAEVDLHTLLQSELGLTPEQIHEASGYALISFPQAFPHPVNYFNGRLIFSYIERDKVLYFSGRITDRTPANDFARDAKFLHLNIEKAGLKSRPLYLEPAYNTPVFLVEGHTHALRLRQEGFCAVASGGNPNPEHLKILRRVPDLFWIPDVDVLAPHPEGFIEKDGAKIFQPGRTRQDALTSVLTTLRELPRARLICYDDDFCSRFPHGDQTDWWMTGSSEAFLQLRAQALSLDQIEVKAIPVNLDSARLAERIEEFLIRITWRSPIESDAILQDMQNHLDLNKGTVSELKRRLKKLREQGTAAPEDQVSERATDFTEIFPGQYFDGKHLYYTLSRRVLIRKSVKGEEISTVKIIPFVISSKPELFPADEVSMAQRKLFFHPGSNPDPDAEQFWSDEDGPFSLGAFMANPADNTPDTAALYSELRAFIAANLHHNNPYLYDVIATWIWMTYCHQIFDVVPYLHFIGTRESGKSRALEIIEAVSFCPNKISSASTSYLFRGTELHADTVLYDEAEQFSSMLKINDTVSEIFLLWCDGYRKGGAVGRTAGENKDTPRRYRIYCPKASANTKGLYATLASRSIIFSMKRCPFVKDMPPWGRHIIKPIAHSIRNRFYCWALAHAHRIAEAQNRLNGEMTGLLKEVGFRGRERELWLPLFTVALVLDELSSGIPFQWDPARGLSGYPPLDRTVFGNLLEAQAHLSDYKRQMLLEQDSAPIFLAGLRQMIRQSEVMPVRIERDSLPTALQEGWYSSSAVKKYLVTLEGLKNWPRKTGPNSLIPVLRHTFELLKDEDILKHKSPSDRSSRRYFRLDNDRLDGVCKTYDVPFDATVEVVEESTADARPQTEEDV